MKPNVRLLRATLAHIEANPDQLNSEWYRYTTGKCFGGHAIELAGGRWVVDDPEEPLGEFLHPEPDDDPAAVLHMVPDDYRAARVLGLTDEQAAVLFAPDNTLADLRRIVADLVEGGDR